MSPPQLADLEKVYGTFISVTLSLVSIASLVMILVSGFNYLGAGGDKEALARAQRTFTYSLFGLILAISAWLILQLLGSFLGVELKVFKITF